MDNNIEKVEQNLQGKPEHLIKEAVEASKVLIDIVTKNGWASNIQGKNYLQFEAWQTLGKFYGCTVKTKETKYVEYGAAKGFEASVEVIDRNGNIVGGAEGVCLNDEQNWKGKPLYALKSMAQTRAGARALRQMFSWVAVMAGYQPAPKEEMGAEIIAQLKGEKPLHSEGIFKPCPLHEGMSFKQYEKNGATWFSHIGPDGKWCNEANIKKEDEVKSEQEEIPVGEDPTDMWKKTPNEL